MIEDDGYGIKGLVDDTKEFLGTPIGLAIGAGVLGTAIAGTALAARAKTSKSRKKSRKLSHTKRGLKQDRARRSKQKWEVAYQKRKRAARKGGRGKIKHTKNGQPYIILSSGKAKFIKKRRR